MAGVVVNELVTKLSAKMDKTWDNYEKMLKNLDKRAALAGKATAKQFTASFEQVSKNVRRTMENTFKGIQKAGNRIKINPTIGVRTGRAMSNIRAMEGAVDRLGKRMSGLVLGVGGGVLGGAGIAAAGKFGFNAASEYETAITRLNTLMGPQKSQGIFKNLQKFAAKTPYGIKDVMDMFVRLQGAGFELADRKSGKIDYQKLVKLGDLASASNKPLNELVDAILSSGRGLGSMVDNFIGLNAKAQGDGMLAATMTDVRTGKVKNFDIDTQNKKQLFDFWLQAGERTGIKGGMFALSGTIEGQMSTLTDSMKNLAQKAFKGFGPELHKALNMAINGLDKFEGHAERIGKYVGNFIRADLPGWLNAIGKAAPYAAFGLGLFSAQWTGLKLLAGVEMLSKFGGFLKLLPGVIKFAQTAGAWATIQAAFAAIGSSATVIGGGFLAISLAAIDFIRYFQTGNSVMLDFTKKWPGLNKFIRDAYDNTKLFVFALQIGFENIGKSIQKFGKGFKITLSDFTTSWTDFVDNIVGYWQDKFKWVGDGLRNFSNLWKEMTGQQGGALGQPANTRGYSAASEFLASGKADEFAKRDAEGWFNRGVACNYFTKQLLRYANVRKDVVDKMSNRVPDTFAALKQLEKEGKVKEIPFSQAGSMDVAINSDMSHIGVLGRDKNSLIHASNQAGRLWTKSGARTLSGKTLGQRPVEANNYFGASGHYFRIMEDAKVGQGLMSAPQVTVTIGNINAGPNGTPKQIAHEIKKATEDGVSKSLSKAAAKYGGLAARQ